MSAPTTPLLARPGEEPDRGAAFRALLRRWLDVPLPCNRLGRTSDRTMSALADILGVPKQKIGKWNEPEGTAPWWVVMWLCADLGLALYIEPHGLSICVSRPRSGAPES